MPAAALNPREVITGVRLAIGLIRSDASRMSSNRILSSNFCFAICCSIPGMFVHHVQQSLSFPEPFQIFKEAIESGIEKSLYAIGRVRRQQYIGHSPKRMLSGQRLDREYVQRRAPDLLRLQCLNERWFVDYRSPAHVNDHRG